jgi:ATP-binding cassette subfamily B protein
MKPSRRNRRQTGTDERNYRDWDVLIRAWSYLRPYWHLVLGGYLFLLLITLLLMVNPQLIRWIVDEGIGQQDFSLLRLAVLGLLGVTLLRSVLAFFQGRWIEQSSQSVAYDLRNKLYDKLSSLSFSYHDRTEAGQLLARAMQDVERLRYLNGRATMRLVESAVTLVVTAGVLLWMNTRLAALSMLTIPVLAVQAYFYSKTLRPMWYELRDRISDMTSWVEQNLRGARIVKGFAQEENEIARFEAQNEGWFELAQQTMRIRAVNNPLIFLIANISTIFIIWYGGRLVVQDRLTLGELVAFTSYMGQVIHPVRTIGRIVPFISQAIASGERIFEILDAESEVKEAPDAKVLPVLDGHVRFDGVSFAYFGRHQVLEDVSLEAEPGEIIALLGTTGSGKSTIINLIPRFYDVTEGRVMVDGYDVRDVTLNSLRDQIGIVLQETTLFAATVGENIAFGDPDATQEEIVAAAQAAQAHDFISAMPEGYETPVGERGSTLSGGQKQRVAIARALLKDPRILILDDATSSVDTETERLIQKALANLMKGRTSFVIAQRLSTVRMADQILVLDKGKIVARGSHERLLETSEIYAQIYEQQLRPQEVSALKDLVSSTQEKDASTSSQPRRHLGAAVSGG